LTLPTGINDTAVHLMSTEWIAALPMYDFPDLAAAHDAWWHALAERLGDAGIPHLPQSLNRTLGHHELWRHPRLLLGQACEYPLATTFHPWARPLASPRYAAPGCEGSRYRSAVVVRRDHPAATLIDLRGSRCVINEPHSNSGMNLLRAVIAPIALRRPFFGSVSISGSHWQSARQLADGSADVAAIDCVTYAHLQRFDAALVARLRILDWTPASPSLPLITARSTDEPTRQALRDALAGVAADPGCQAICASLRLQGFDFEVDERYREVLDLERHAAALGYPVLA
jgi:ABC-type phosphate/phosphonate transport system substrate-binding protein